MYTQKRSSGNDSFETPDEFFNALDEEFHFTLDVCATLTNTKCERYYNRQLDALQQSWKGEVCWMNPPYSEKRHWIKKAYEESKNGATVVCLVPANTDTRWFHDYAMKGELRFVRGKLKFKGCKDRAPFPSLLVIFR